MIWNILKAIFSLAELPLYLLPLIRTKAVIPMQGEAGQSSLQTKYFNNSILEGLSSAGLDTLAVIGMALAVVNFGFSVLCLMFKKNESIKKISSIIFIVSLIVFVLLFILAAAQKPHY